MVPDILATASAANTVVTWQYIWHLLVIFLSHITPMKMVDNEDLITPSLVLYGAISGPVSPTSCLVSTTWIPSLSQATRIGEMCPPTSVNTYFTPWACKHNNKSGRWKYVYFSTAEYIINTHFISIINNSLLHIYNGTLCRLKGWAFHWVVVLR